MPIIATTKAAGERFLAPAGTFVARCYKMIHIGTITDQYQGQDRLVNKILIEWELPTELRVFNPERGQQPISVSKEFALSMHPKSTLRAFLTSWRGKGFSDEEAAAFDVEKLIGAACQLSIIHEPKKNMPGEYYAKISNVSSLMKGFKAPDQINPSFAFSLQSFDQSKFDVLPDWLKAKIMTSQEYQAIKSPEIAHRESVKAAVDSWVDPHEEKYNQDHDDDVLPF